MSSCGVTNVKMPICISSNTSPAMDLTRLSSCQEWKVLQSDASTKHHEDSQSAEKWQSFLVFNDSHVQIVSKAQCGHFVRHLDTAFHWDLCNEPWQTEWWNRFGAWLAKRKMTLDTSYAILGCSLCSWVLWKKWKAASLGSLKGHCTTVHFSNALGARMTVPHECRYFHPLDAEANSHVAEDLHGEVAQGAVPNLCKVATDATEQTVEHFGTASICSIMFQSSLHLGHHGPLECQKDQHGPSLVTFGLVFSALKWFTQWHMQQASYIHQVTCHIPPSRCPLECLHSCNETRRNGTQFYANGNYHMISDITWCVSRLDCELAQENCLHHHLPVRSIGEVAVHQLKKLQLIARHKCSVHCTCSPHPTAVTRMQYRS